MCPSPLEGWLKQVVGPHPRVTDSAILGGAHDLHFSQGDADAGVPERTGLALSGLTSGEEEAALFEASMCLYLPLHCPPSSVI